MAIWRDSYLSNLNISYDCIYDKIIPSDEVPQSISINGKPNKYKTYTKPVYLVDKAVNMSNYNLTTEQAVVELLNSKKVVPDETFTEIPRPPEIFTGRDNFHETKNREILMTMYGLNEFSFPKLRALIKEDIEAQSRFVKFTNADITNYIAKITSTNIPDKETIAKTLSETQKEHEQRQQDNRPYTRSEAMEYYKSMRERTPVSTPTKGDMPSSSEPIESQP